MFFSSKAIGQFIYDKLKWTKQESIGVGYFANLGLFFLLQFPVMIFKLSSVWLMCFGGVYLCFIIAALIWSIYQKKLFVFTKKELIALAATLGLMILYFCFLNFGTIETYDSYFYSVLTSSAKNANQVSVIDPYTGLANLQNYYKYISYYYQATFFSGLFQINYAYLVLIWPFTFMNYFLLMYTAVTICRFTKNKYANHFLSIFFVTCVLSIFRAPFNALHMLTFVVPIYCFYYIFHYFKTSTAEGKKYLLLFSICTLAGISFSSTTLFVMLPFIYVIYITNCICKKEKHFLNIFYIALPIIFLGFLYLYESLDTLWVLVVGIFFLFSCYLLLRTKWFNKFLFQLGKGLIVIVPILLCLMPLFHVDQFLKTRFMKGDAISAGDEIGNAKVPSCLGENTIELKENNLWEFDSQKHSTAMEYIHGKTTSKASTILIMLTHSIFKYGGMLALFLYGIFYLRKDPRFIAFIIYLVTFANPLVKSGVNTVTFGLGYRISLFFTMYFALLGIAFAIKFIQEKLKGKPQEKQFETLLHYGWICYLVLSVLSIGAYIHMLKPVDFKNYNLLYKVPKQMDVAEQKINHYFDQNKRRIRPKVLYTSSVFNLSMIDQEPNNKIKVMNSKEQMLYFSDPSKITDKVLMNIYFENEGKLDLTPIVDHCKYLKDRKKLEHKTDCNCNIDTLLKAYSVDFVITKVPTDPAFLKSLEAKYPVIYRSQDILMLQINRKR